MTVHVVRKGVVWGRPDMDDAHTLSVVATHDDGHTDTLRVSNAAVVIVVLPESETP